jgi:hypothetical protein
MPSIGASLIPKIDKTGYLLMATPATAIVAHVKEFLKLSNSCLHALEASSVNKKRNFPPFSISNNYIKKAQQKLLRFLLAFTFQ